MCIYIYIYFFFLSSSCNLNELPNCNQAQGPLLYHIDTLSLWASCGARKFAPVKTWYPVDPAMIILWNQIPKATRCMVSGRSCKYTVIGTCELCAICQAFMSCAYSNQLSTSPELVIDSSLSLGLRPSQCIPHCWNKLGQLETKFNFAAGLSVEMPARTHG